MQDEALTDVNPFEDLSFSEVLAELYKPRSSSRPYTNADRVHDFHWVLGVPINQWPPTYDEAELRDVLISEEYSEFQEELFSLTGEGSLKRHIDKKAVAKELADLLYVVYGTAVAFGIDIDRVFEEVHKSNMSKLVDGKPLRREDGKVLKGPNYKEPDLSFVT